jgi:starch synthase (maltosyl-transferring)
MAFDHVLSAPIFAPGKAGDVFLTGDPDRAHPAFGFNNSADEAATALADKARQCELNLMVDIVIDRVDPNGRLAASEPRLFARQPGQRIVDPRFAATLSHAAPARLDTIESAHALIGFWRERLQRLLDAGVAGFRFLHPQALTATLWRKLLGDLKKHAPNLAALAWTPGLKWLEIEQLAGAGFDGVFCSLAWWDYSAAWFVEEYDVLRGVSLPSSVVRKPRSSVDSSIASARERMLRPRIAGHCGSRRRASVACSFQWVLSMPPTCPWMRSGRRRQTSRTPRHAAPLSKRSAPQTHLPIAFRFWDRAVNSGI